MTDKHVAHVEWLEKNDAGMTAVVTFESDVTPEQVEQYKRALGRITSFIEPVVEVTEETPDWKESREDLDPEIETLIGDNLEDLI